MSIVLVGSTSGSITLQEPAVAGTTVLDLPAVSGTILTTTSPKAGNVLQVVQATKTDTATTSSTTYASLLSANITPTSSSSKILVVANISIGGYGSTPALRLNRGGTDILLSNTSGNRQRTTYGMHWSASNALDFVQYLQLPVAMTYLDSPSTTSSTTYAVYWAEWNGTTTFCNRSYGNADATWSPTSTSSITLMEIAG
jgi:hypothetical protein